MEFEIVGLVTITCAIISAKWALELKYSLPSQILFAVACLFFGPFPLLILYIHMIRKVKNEGKVEAQRI